MDDTEIIAKQQREIEDLKARVASALEALSDAHLCVVGIGGPLNDDRYGCSKEQRQLFRRIDGYVEVAIDALGSSGS